MKSEENPESVDRFDPYINKTFIEIFEHADNAELARSFVVGLPVNDPERVEDASVPSGVAIVQPTRGDVRPVTVAGSVEHDHDVVSGVDKDGDTMRVSYVAGITPEYDCDAALIFCVNDDRFLMPIERVRSFMRWLESRVEKHDREQAAE